LIYRKISLHKINFSLHKKFGYIEKFHCIKFLEKYIKKIYRNFTIKKNILPEILYIQIFYKSKILFFQIFYAMKNLFYEMKFFNEKFI